MNEFMPELSELQQMEEDDYDTPPIVVPVRICEIEDGPLSFHVLPAREAIMRNFVLAADDTVQILGRDLRRSRAQVWAVTSGATATSIIIGTDRGEVEQETAAQLPVMLDDLTIGAPFRLDMSHVKEMWVKNTHSDPVTVSVVAEYWAD